MTKSSTGLGVGVGGTERADAAVARVLADVGVPEFRYYSASLERSVEDAERSWPLLALVARGFVAPTVAARASGAAVDGAAGEAQPANDPQAQPSASLTAQPRAIAGAPPEGQAGSDPRKTAWPLLSLRAAITRAPVTATRRSIVGAEPPPRPAPARRSIPRSPSLTLESAAADSAASGGTRSTSDK